jgi:hypothetical protein
VTVPPTEQAKNQEIWGIDKVIPLRLRSLAVRRIESTPLVLGAVNVTSLRIISLRGHKDRHILGMGPPTLGRRDIGLEKRCVPCSLRGRKRAHVHRGTAVRWPKRPIGLGHLSQIPRSAGPWGYRRLRSIELRRYFS